MKNSQTLDPTLLIFTVGARTESRRRRLLPSSLRELEHALHQQCLESTLAAGRASRCRLLVASPEQLKLGLNVDHLSQQGANFGERLRHAYADGRKRCEGPLILVGSDAPGLNSDHLSSALMSLKKDRSRVVVGPSPDGGFYLLASNDPLPDEIWNQVRWRNRNTLSCLLKALRESGRAVDLLPPLTDLDRRSDLQAWLATVRMSGPHLPGWKSLLGRLHGLLRALCLIVAPPRLGNPFSVPILLQPGRAPPC
jgi:glycosyltransferase A (GT-A) superfamily protein (DUF2064 family)